VSFPESKVKRYWPKQPGNGENSLEGATRGSITSSSLKRNAELLSSEKINGNHATRKLVNP